MAVLTSGQRSTLENAVKAARKAAETGAYNALSSLAVDQTEPFVHMTADERILRNRLRHKGRLLGDDLTGSGKQVLHKLVYELAYETWHKMLFARFLEANQLLMHTEGVAVTLADCEELAAEGNFLNKWDAAASYASRMLPAIFRVNDPLMQVAFSTNDRIRLEEIIDALDEQIFIADDALGWVYQFWQSEAKERINKSGDKIDGEKLPAVTQLFTEPYMVHFLIDNTLGAWWVSRNPGVKPPVKFEYLRYLTPKDGTATEPVEVAAGTFEAWPDKTANITTLDPCMGSGHFVVSLFQVMAPLRMFEEKLTRKEAAARVITDNLHGLELDPRCTQIAAFNLALAAWKFCGEYTELPEMNLACSGIAPKGKAADWVKLVGKVADPVLKERMENGMLMLYEHFQLAPELGSLLDPTTIKADAFTASFAELQPALKRALENEADTEQLERGVMAAGIAKAGQLLSPNYTLVITNVPYLGFKKQDAVLKRFCEKIFTDSKMDLATVFLKRSLNLLSNKGTIATITPQNWLFLGMYESFRKNILKENTLNSIALLGPGAFSQITGEVVKAIIAIISKGVNPIYNNFFLGISCIEAPFANKSDCLKNNKFILVNQKKQSKNPNARIVFSELGELGLLESFSISRRGVVSGDKDYWFKCFWELDYLNSQWKFLQSTVENPCFYGGKFQIVNWSTNGIGMLRPGLGNQAYGKRGIVINQMGELSSSLYLGELYDNNVGVIVPKNENDLIAIYSYCNSPEFNKNVREIDQSLAVTNATLIKVPFDINYWQKVAAEKYPSGLPKPYSDDPTQWLFHGHPAKSESPLQVALARLLGYRWPAETDTEMELADEARELIAAIKATDHLSDEDGIICIPSVNAEPAAADRLRDFLQQVFGSQWNNLKFTQLLAKEEATTTNPEEWLRREFFARHCKVFQNRPFIWHIWDGRNDGFAALVNYHKLNKDTLEKLIYTYLGDWIRMCESRKRNGESGAEGLLVAALRLREKLEAILAGEAPLDIFVRWKPIKQQPIGWEPDLNDGVRLNIRPFILADVLRKKPNIKWGVDRGKNPPGSHWGEVRDNDRHLSLEEKRAARENTQT